jgi:hypothetical protein
VFLGLKLNIMARRNTEPVRHTCPDIDRLISTITQIVKEMDESGEEDDKDDLLSLIQNWSSDLRSIGVGKWCELETLRNSNGSLRDWGSEMYDDAEKMENERDEWESKCAELEGKVSDLESIISDLEDTVSEHSL